MHRIVTLFVIVCVALVSGGYSPAVVHGQFATNTPSGAPDANAQATENPDSSGGGFSFATNTPAGPAPTATASPSATPTITPTPTATFTPTNTPTPTPIPIGPFSYPQGINPLTGLPYPDEAAVARRNLIVKISNYPPIVRPQHGVNAADVVYEYEAEGGVTRFAAIYRSQAPERVGSVRSARLIDIELVTMYRALLAYSGTSAPIQNLLLGEGFFEYQLISPSVGHPESATNDCDTTVFCRNTSLLDSGTPREHTLFGNTNLMWDIATRQGSNTGYVAFGFAFNEQADANGRPALDIDIDWWGQTDSRWQYDEASGRYVRYTDGVAHFDAADGEQLWADNLIMVEVPHVDRPDLFPAGANYTSLGIELWDQGFVYVMREGQVYQGYWRRRDREPGSALQIIYGDNTPIMLKPGRTWVTLVRGLGNVVVSAEKVDVQATATVLALTPSPTPLDLPGD